MKYTNILNLNESIADAIIKETYDVAKDDMKIISVTSLIDDPKIVTLRKRHWNDVVEDVSENIWMLMGSAIHYVLSLAKAENRIIEQRFEYKYDEYIITGKPDLYDKTTKKITDYKNTSVWAAILNKNGKKEWDRQLNAYAWLLRKNGLEVNELEIILILRDWSKREYTKKYQIQQTKIKKAIEEGKSQEYIDSIKIDYPEHQVIVQKVKLYNEGIIDEFIAACIKNHRIAQNLPDDNIPECSEGNRWHRGDSWAIYKDQDSIDKSKRARKVEKEKEENAYAYARSLVPSGIVVKRYGVDIRCLDYCKVCNFCNFYKETVLKNENIEEENEENE